MFSKRVIVCLVFLLASGCAGPDVTEQVKAFSNAVEESTKVIGPDIKRAADKEAENAKFAMIAQGSSARKAVYARPIECYAIADQPLKANFADCRLSPNYEVPNAKGTAVYYQEALAALRDYGAVLNSLAISESPAEIGKNFGDFLGSINGFASAVNATDGEPPVKVDHIKPLGSIGTALADAKRYRAIRRVVNDAHEPIERVLDELIAYNQIKTELDGDSEDLDKAYDEMRAAHNSGNVVRYRRATIAWEKQLAAYQKAVKKSATGELAAIWQAQRALHARVNQSGEPETAIEILENIKALSD